MGAKNEANNSKWKSLLTFYNIPSDRPFTEAREALIEKLRNGGYERLIIETNVSTPPTFEQLISGNWVNDVYSLIVRSGTKPYVDRQYAAVFRCNDPDNIILSVAWMTNMGFDEPDWRVHGRVMAWAIENSSIIPHDEKLKFLGRLL